jgi:hypothetical protein
LKRDDKEVFDSVIVVTDRRLLDQQIQTTIKQFMQVGATVGHAERSGDLRKFIQDGKKIIVSTVQKFPFILDEIATEGGKTFAIVIDEAHSSQGGKTSAAMSQALGTPAAGDEDGSDPEDTVNEALEKRMAARKMLTNAQPLRLHRHAEEQDAGDVRRAVAARRRRARQAPAVPQLHHEAGGRGGFHPRRAEELHAGGQLLPHHATRRGDRPEQAARPEGGAGWRAGVFAGAGAAGGSVVPRRRRARPARSDP